MREEVEKVQQDIAQARVVAALTQSGLGPRKD